MALNRYMASALLAAAGTFGMMGSSHAMNIAGWTCTGNCGTLGADGVVTLSPTGASEYGWVSTAGGVNGVVIPSVGGTNGSRILSPLFHANAGDNLQFFFNYITSDGAGFADYAGSRLLNADMTEAAILFTARTTPGGDTVPGFGMPPLSVTLNPASTPIIPGGPAWSPLAGYSGACFNTGCGYTGWIEADYQVAVAGDYYLTFGATNWSDTIYDSGLAFDGATIAGVPIDDSNIPEPGSLALLGLGLAGLTARQRRRVG